MRYSFLHGSALATTPRGRGKWRFMASAAVLAAAIGLVPSAMHAQRNTIPVVTTIDSMRADGSVVPVPIRTDNSFNLFASEDIACAAYRSTGQMTGGAANQRGPVPTNQGGGCIAAHIYGNRTGYVYCDMGLSMSAPP